MPIAMGASREYIYIFDHWIHFCLVHFKYQVTLQKQAQKVTVTNCLAFLCLVLFGLIILLHQDK